MIKFEDVKSVLIYELGNLETINENVLKISYEEAIERIRNYCSIDEIPMGLFYTLTNITRDLYLFYNSFNIQNTNAQEQEQSSIDVKDIESIKMGDTTISLKKDITDSSPIKRDYSVFHDYSIDKIVNTYADSLNEYRRMIW